MALEATATSVTSDPPHSRPARQTDNTGTSHSVPCDPSPSPPDPETRGLDAWKKPVPPSPPFPPFPVRIDLSTSTTIAITLKLAKESGAGPPPGADCSWVTSAVEVALSTAGQPAASKVRLLAAPVTMRAVSRKPARLKKNGSLRSPVKTRNLPLELVMPERLLASPVT